MDCIHENASVTASGVLDHMRASEGLARVTLATEEETDAYRLSEKAGKPLPDGVYSDGEGTFYTVNSPELTESERFEYLLLKQNERLENMERKVNTAKNCLVLFTVLSVISLIISIILVGFICFGFGAISQMFEDFSL